MVKQVISIGTNPNDNTGDPLRTAFDKINQNFTELYNFINVRNMSPALLRTGGLILGAPSLVGANQGYMSPPAGYSLSQLIFEDKFLGTSLDTSKWSTEIADEFGPWRNNGALPSPYTSVGVTGGYNAEYGDPAQVVVNNGVTLTATRSSAFANYTWKSGYLCTHNKFYFTGGYVQVRAKAPDCSTGAWPGIWHLEGGAEIDTQEGGYISGAVDVNRILAVSTHTSGNNQQLIDTGVDLSADYHVYGMEYKPGVSVKYYLDGVLRATQTANIPTGGMTVILTLQMAQNSSGWHPVVSGATPNGLQFKISHVQVFSLP